MSKSFLIIGLGRFGQSTARMLTTLGHEVVAVDKRADRVVQPEHDGGIRLARSLVAEGVLDSLDLSDEYSINEVEIP